MTEHYEHVFEAADGLQVMVRRVRPDDAPLLIDVFKHMSRASRFYRFNEYLDNPDPDYVRAKADELAKVDPEQGTALLAFATLPGEGYVPVAGARYMRTGQRAAEVAVAVRDDLHGRAIGSHLLEYLMGLARTQGVRWLLATFHVNNQGVWQLLRRSPYQLHREVRRGEVDVVIDLEQPVGGESPGPPLAASAGR